MRRKLNCHPLIYPNFWGRYIEWMNFKSQFTTLIDHNEHFSDSQKLYCLQLALTDPVKQLQNIDDSYAPLFETLRKRFENKIHY